MKDLIIFGAADAAQLAHYYFTKEGQFRVAAFIVDGEFKNQENFCGLPVVRSEDVSKTFPPSKFMAFVAIGYAGMNGLRKSKFQWFKKNGYKMATYLSPEAINHSTQIGENCFIQEGCIIQPFVKIGDNVTIWSGAHIGHHSIIGDHSFIAPRAALSGHVTVKENSFIGINATVKDHVIISNETLIAGGALVVEDTTEKSLYKSVKASAYQLTPETIKKI